MESLSYDYLSKYEDRPVFSFAASASKEPLVLVSESKVLQVPATINQYLRDYQRDGVRFMFKHFAKCKGAILGDDMGLGKTIQAIAFISAIIRLEGTKEDVLRHMSPCLRKELGLKYETKIYDPVLIVCPKSVVHNWIDEFETWGYFTVGKYYGKDRDETLQAAKLNKLDVVVTTLETARDCVDNLNIVPWSAVFVDEAHRLKEPKSQLTCSLKTLKCKTRFGLTGTAFQNNMKEFWCIFDWANPGCVKSLQGFMEYYARPIEAGLRQDATKRMVAEGRVMKDILTSIRMKWMLRRTKTVIAKELPKKTDKVILCKLSDLQCDIYKTLLEKKDVQLVLTQFDPCNCGSCFPRGKCCFKKNKIGESVFALTFTYMHLLMKIANHIALLSPGNSKNMLYANKAEEIWHKVLLMKKFSDLQKKLSFASLCNPKYSGKMEVLIQLLDVFQRQGDKVLLFSHYTTVLNILEYYLKNVGYQFRRLDGSTKAEARTQIVKEFNSKPEISMFLISTKAGGVGLNITGANIVILYDLSWNPAHEQQAQDRAYRIGQSRDVHVYQLISSGTIEENMYLRQLYKLQLNTVALSDKSAKRYFCGVAGDPTYKGEIFGLKNMFSLRIGDACLTEEILKRNENIEKEIKQHTNRTDALTVLSETKEFNELDIHSYNVKVSVNVKIDQDTKKYVKEFFPELEDVPLLDEQNIFADPSDSIEYDEITTDNAEHTSVESVLTSKHVVHVHANKVVVGGSSIEEHVALCAVKDVFENQADTQELAIYCNPLQPTIDLNMPVEVETKRKPLQHRRPQKTVLQEQVIQQEILMKHIAAPNDKRVKLFWDIASMEGISPSVLADRVLAMNEAERCQILHRFYMQNSNLHASSSSKILKHDNKEQENSLTKSSLNNSDENDFIEPVPHSSKDSSVSYKPHDNRDHVQYKGSDMLSDTLGDEKEKPGCETGVVCISSETEGLLNNILFPSTEKQRKIAPYKQKQLTNEHGNSKTATITSFSKHEPKSKTHNLLDIGICVTHENFSGNNHTTVLDSIQSDHQQIPGHSTRCTEQKTEVQHSSVHSMLDSIFFSENSPSVNMSNSSEESNWIKVSNKQRQIKVVADDHFTRWVKSGKFKKIDKSVEHNNY